LIGGLNFDSLDGGSWEDILIAGLTGGVGTLDWFYRHLTDLVTDLNGEVIDEL